MKMVERTPGTGKGHRKKGKMESRKEEGRQGERRVGKEQDTIPERLFATFSPGTLALCGLWA